MKVLTRRASAVVLVAALAACASSGKAGVRVDTIQANIVFGVTEPTPGEVAAPTVAVADSGNGTALRVPQQGRRPFEIPTTAVTQTTCPQAPLGSAPEAAAAENASKPPAPGLYRYKVSGTEVLNTGGQDLTFDLTGFQPRLVRNVQQSSDTLWTYEVVTPGGSGGSDVTRWSVNTKAVQRTANVSVGKEVTVGEPARGIALAALDSFDGNGNNTASFRPAPPILELPLPVISGASYNGAGVDPKSGQTEQVSGTIQHRQSVDACGTLIDGWLTHLDIQQTVDGITVSRSEDDVFSNDLGGMLISQHTVETITGSNGSQKLDVTYSIGQVTPSDLPGAST